MGCSGSAGQDLRAKSEALEVPTYALLHGQMVLKGCLNPNGTFPVTLEAQVLTVLATVPAKVLKCVLQTALGILAYAEGCLSVPTLVTYRMPNGRF